MSFAVTNFLSCAWPIVGTNFSEWVQIYQKNSLRGDPLLGGSKLNVTGICIGQYAVHVPKLIKTDAHLGEKLGCIIELQQRIKIGKNLRLVKEAQLSSTQQS